MIIFFHDWNPDPATTFLEAGDHISCKVTFEATHDSNWSALGVGEGFALSGDLAEKDTILKTHTLARDVTMKKGERRTYDFSTRTGRAVTYLGVNGAAEPTLVGFANRAPGSSRALRKLMGEKDIIHEQVKMHVRDKPGFGVEGDPVELKAVRDNGWMVFFLIGIMALGVLGISAKAILALAGALAALYAAVYAFRSGLIRRIGKVTVSPYPTGGSNWTAKVELEETGDRIKKIFAGYAVIEEVTDGRGDKIRIAQTNIYESPVDERPGDGIVYRFEHQFPAGYPPSRNYGDLKIYWRYRVTIKAALGLSFTYEAPLEVEAGVEALPLAGRSPQTIHRTRDRARNERENR